MGYYQLIKTVKTVSLLINYCKTHDLNRGLRKPQEHINHFNGFQNRFCGGIS